MMGLILYIVLGIATSTLLFLNNYREWGFDSLNVFISFFAGIVWPFTWVVAFVWVIARAAR